MPTILTIRKIRGVPRLHEIKMSPTQKPRNILLLAAILVAIGIASIFAAHRRAQRASTARTTAPHINWFYNAGPGALSGIALALDGTIHFAAADGIYALSPAGQLLWKAPLPFGPVVAAPTLSPDGTLYLASQSGKLFALDRSGSLIWESVDTKHKLVTPPALGDGPTLYATDDHSNVFAFAPSVQANYQWDLVTFDNSAKKDGLLLGSNNPYDPRLLYSTPAIGRDDMLYLVHESWLYQISPNAQIQHYTQFYGGSPGFPAIGPEGNVYIGGHHWATLAAIDVQGQQLWGTRTSGPVLGSPVIDLTGQIYFCDSDFAKAYSTDGRQIWYLQLACNSGPALASDGTLFLGVNGPSPRAGPPLTYLVAVSSDGHLKWKTEIHGAVRDAPAIAPDGTIFFTTDQGYVYSAFDSGASPMDSSWPRFQHDAQNTGHLAFYH
jgi:outer membrane protein assembly factor BamB